LAGGIANDFNNILGAILGNLALAREELGHHPAALHSLEHVNTAARRATALVREILTFSRLEPHDLVLRPLQPLLHESLNSLRASLPAGVKLEATFVDAPLHVLADGAKIHEVLINLCTNAVQALQGREGRIAVGLEAIEFRPDSTRRPPALAPGEYAHLWVRDSGCGMDMATRSRIFEPFFTTRAKGRGAGMGLSVVHGIVATHQGAITVDSTPGQGSTFHMYLPLARAQDEAQKSSLTLPAQRQGNGQHVLYLDDDEMMLLLADTLLRRQGYRVTCFQDPHLALDAVRAQPQAFDLVVTDVNMRDLSGFEVARELARIRADLPVAVSSGDLGDERRAELERCGVRGLIHKESMFAELGPMVDRLLVGV
jgi:CheY-like chemotaxis protein